MTRQQVFGGLFGLCAGEAIGAQVDSLSHAEPAGGDGVLMRILPLAFTLGGLPFPDRFERIAGLSSLTHARPPTLIACAIYCDLALELLEGRAPQTAHERSRVTIHRELHGMSGLQSFRRVIEGDLPTLASSEIHVCSGVAHTLEAAIWAFLGSNDYEWAVFTAADLGGDSRASGALAGGLAGIAFGFDAIPKEWVQSLPRRVQIQGLAERLLAATAVSAAGGW